jgi:hypothetical protein
MVPRYVDCFVFVENILSILRCQGLKAKYYKSYIYAKHLQLLPEMVLLFTKTFRDRRPPFLKSYLKERGSN